MENMTQVTCNVCEGELKQDITYFIVKVDDLLIVITKVPALVCMKCGEKYYSPSVSRKIDKVMKEYYDNRYMIKELLSKISSTYEDVQSNQKYLLPFSPIPALEIELPA